MQTPIDFLVSKIASKIDDKYYSNQQDITEYVEQANKMFEQQIIDAYIIADSESTQEDSEHNALKFYKRTYGSKGSDGHELDDDIPPTSQYFPTSSQTEHNLPKVENKDSFGKIRFTEEEWAELNNVSKGSDDHIVDTNEMVYYTEEQVREVIRNCFKSNSLGFLITEDDMMRTIKKDKI